MTTNQKAYLALGVVCLVWGTTYLGMRIGVQTFPPLLFSGIRHTVAGLSLFIFLLTTRKLAKISWRDFSRQAIPGVLMIGLGNGLVGWSERYIPSGLAALIVSIMPVYVVAINYFSGIDTRLLNRNRLVGLLLGCLGIGLIFRDNVQDLANPDYFKGVLVSFGACLSWASGSIYVKQKPTATNALINSAIQLTSGGLVLLLGGFLFDNLQEIDTVSAQSIYALIYLILFGSLLAYMCFLYALKRLHVELVSIYAYINPFIALILGSLVLGESITWITGLALLTTLSGVWYLSKSYSATPRMAVK
ncbi:EamA family transporter [Larkinella terrae]|uniref:EamA family transporter n=1 Tax=Larkinella terrae TaxID=2025311 RepID=A0A7K0ES62_9BACT|nr:EamA family transporter [Larkinella terrae]MRS64654.1 EamA family transporter [Larkinella terrae]